MGAPLGNKNASKQNRLVTDTIHRALTQDPDKLRAAVDKLLDNAADGDLNAFKELTDRIQGKPAQAIVGGDENDNPVKLSGVLEFMSKDG